MRSEQHLDKDPQAGTQRRCLLIFKSDCHCAGPNGLMTGERQDASFHLRMVFPGSCFL